MSQENPPDPSFEQRTREVLDESTSKLDGRTLSRLTQARHAALATQDRPVRTWWRSYLPAGAAAAAAVLAVMIWNASGFDPAAPLPEASNTGSTFEDMDLLADSDAPDFVTESEDVDFYEWAAGEIES